MDAVADTDVTKIPKHDDEESGYLMLIGGSGEALTESAEECESNGDHFDGASGWEEDDGIVHDCYNEDEGTTYEETDVYESSYGYDEYDEAVGFEDEEKTFDNFNEETGATQRPLAGFNDDSSYEVDGSGEHDQTSGLKWTNNNDMDWNPPSVGPRFFRKWYVEGTFILDIPPKILHAFLRHLINVLEASFYHFGEDLKSDKWRWKILVSHPMNQPWDKIHAVELKIGSNS